MNQPRNISLLSRNSLSDFQSSKRTSITQKDAQFEFNALKYVELSVSNEDYQASDLKEEDWFLDNFMRSSFSFGRKSKLSINPRKKKQYSKNLEEGNAVTRLKISKRPKTYMKSTCNISISEPMIKKQNSKISLVKTLEHLDITKEKDNDMVNDYQRDKNVTNTFNHIKKLKRGVSTDTFKFYSRKQKNDSKENVNPTKNKITYCPRIHDAKAMKKWEESKGLKWYDLSPESRMKANDEITLMKNCH